METKRKYSKRTPEERHDRLIDRLSRLKLGLAKKEGLIRKLEAKLKPRITEQQRKADQELYRGE